MINEMRGLVARIGELERRLANIMVDGVVAGVDHARDHYRVRVGGETGDYLTPWIARGDEDAGVGITHRPMKAGQQVRVLSRDGEIGAGTSLVYPASYRDAFPQPSQDGEAFVWKHGNTVITVKDGHFEVNVAGRRLVITGDEIVTHGRTRLDNGTRRVHYVGGVDSAGDVAVSGADGVLV